MQRLSRLVARGLACGNAGMLGRSGKVCRGDKPEEDFRGCLWRPGDECGSIDEGQMGNVDIAKMHSVRGGL